MSVSLTALGAGLCAFLRGVVGVLGRDNRPSDGVFLSGDGGPSFEFVRGRDSVESGALYFLGLRNVGVEGRVMSSLEAAMDSGRRGVKATGRAILLADGVGGTDIVRDGGRGIESVEVVERRLMSREASAPRWRRDTNRAKLISTWS